MRRWLCVPMMTLWLLLCGCGQGTEQESPRAVYQTMTGCEMEAVVSCGIGEEDALAFALRCEYLPDGESTVEILTPDTAAGVRAVIDGEKMSVVYEDLCLPAGTLGDANISPAAALPWLMDALRDGWLLEESGERMGEIPCVRLCLDKSDRERQAEATLWLRQEDSVPVRGEINLNGEIILTAEFTAFRFYDTMEQPAGENNG